MSSILADPRFQVRMYENWHQSNKLDNLLANAHINMHNAGLEVPRFQEMAYQPALVAEWEGNAIGIMIYRHDARDESWFIQLSYVSANYRRMGIHTKLFNTLVIRAQKKGIQYIKSGTDAANITAQAAFEKQGRVLTSYYYTYNVPGVDISKDPLSYEL